MIIVQDVIQLLLNMFNPDGIVYVQKSYSFHVSIINLRCTVFCPNVGHTYILIVVTTRRILALDSPSPLLKGRKKTKKLSHTLRAYISRMRETILIKCDK